MSASIRLHPDAQTELDEAYRWYNEQRSGLGTEFLLCVDEAIERVRHDPESWPIVHENARQLLVRRFPYCIIYRVEKTETIIYSVFHGSRNPDIWKHRV